MDGHEVIEQIGSGAFGDAFLVLLKLRIKGDFGLAKLLNKEDHASTVGLVIKLLEFLLTKKVLTARDIGTGCLLYGSLLDDIGIDLPRAPNNFGEALGNLVVVQGLDFEILKELLEKVEDNRFRKAIFDCAMKSISSNPSGKEVLATQKKMFCQKKSYFISNDDRLIWVKWLRNSVPSFFTSRFS